MNLVLAWISLGLGAMVVAFTALQTRPRGERLRLYFPAELAVLIVLAIITLPTQPPWSSGQGMGLSVMMGGLAVYLAALLGNGAASAEEGRHERWHLLLAAQRVALAVVAVDVVVLVSTGSTQYALMGAAVGAAVAGCLISGGLLLANPGSGPRDDVDEKAAAAELAALVTVLLAATCYLGSMHREPDSSRPWTVLPVLFTGVVALGLTVRGVLAGGRAQGWMMTIISAVPQVLVALVIGTRLQGTDAFWKCGLVGLGVGWVLALLARRGRAVRLEEGLLGLLLMAGAGVVAFQLLHGFGLGILALAALAATAGGFAGSERPILRVAGYLGGHFVLYRVYVEATGRTEDFVPGIFHTYAAILLAVAMPVLLVAVGRRWASRSQLQSAALAALITLAAGVPSAIAWILSGDAVQEAYLIGIPVGVALLGISGGADRLTRRWGALLSLPPVLAAITATHLLEPLVPKRLVEKQWWMAGLGVGLLVICGLIASRETEPTAGDAEGSAETQG